MQQTKPKKDSFYNSEFFKRLSQSLESVIEEVEYQSVEEIDVRKLPSSMAKKLVNAMLKKGLLNSKGGVIRDFEVNYLAEVIPYFSTFELKALETNPIGFVKKFSVHPQSRKETSLVCYLKNNEDPQSTSFVLEKKWMDAKQSLFERFSFPIEGYESSLEFNETFYRSPLEIFSRNEIEDILDEFEEIY